jgi:hypothetical protein
MSFQNPDLQNYGPTPLWFWNDRLKEPELRRQIRLMRQGGVHNFIIHARWGLKTPYLSKDWWRMVAASVDEAKKIGSRAWIYDEYNYPSGIGGFKITRQEKFRERFLNVERGQTRSGKALQLLRPKGRLVAAYAYPLKNGRIDESKALPVPTSLRFVPPDQGIYRVFAFAMGVEKFKGSGKYSVNYLAPEPTREFIRMTHDAYAKRFGKDFGKAVPVFFLDEPRFNNSLPWDERFGGWFKKRKGYDLGPKLALLLEDGQGSEGRARRDYYGLISDLYCENFFAPVGRWCRKHGVKLTGHLMAEETLAGNTRYSGHGLKPYQHFQIPGIDYLGKGIGGLTPKMASSMAAHQGKSQVSSETFAGCGWDFSVEEMTMITHWLFSQGINLMIPHAFFYAAITERQRSDWPPSMFFQWKHWLHYPAYAARVARLGEAFSGGKPVADIALYYPMESFHSAYLPNLNFRTGYFRKGPRIEGPLALKLEKSFQSVGQALQQSQRDFQLIDRSTLRRLGAYKALVLPHGCQLDSKALGAVAAFKRKGGKVLQALPGAPARTLKALDGLLKTRDIRLSGASGLQGKVFEWHDKIDDPYLHTNLESVLKKKNGGVMAMHYRKNGEDLYFLASMVPKPLKFKALLRGRGSRVELRWPDSGKIEAVKALSKGGGVSEVLVALPALEAVIVAFKTSGAKS